MQEQHDRKKWRKEEKPMKTVKALSVTKKYQEHPFA